MLVVVVVVVVVMAVVVVDRYTTHVLTIAFGPKGKTPWFGVVEVQ